ncbi:hypothetical protein Clacol_009342 [Clathrus columnatus]|uniref:non-specific serine/threonine protein kinase n=1 Tax=Clathrus columnatus TaxID=1419009 RepID=A0AAV5AMQ1_9AGAM|nr:hypothetical protein Clacol_009342 [Clathrus columnatus]
MFFVHKALSSALDATAMRLSEKEKGKEKPLATPAQHDGFFIAKRGTPLKEGRYKIIRKLSQDHRSNTFLVEDLQSTEPHCKYSAAKILSIDATGVNGYTRELEILLKASEQKVGYTVPPIVILRDHFHQQGLHGRHYCFLTRALSTDVRAFRLSTPTRRLGVHIVKPIVVEALDALEALHLRNIIHAGINMATRAFDRQSFFWAPNTDEIEEMINETLPSVNGTTSGNTEDPILQSEPFQAGISWDITPYEAETIAVVFSNFGAAFLADKPKPLGDIGEFALRAPENIIRAECGKEIDIWAFGCMTYELLTGEILFQPQNIPGLTPDESLLLLQFSVTGETLSKDVIDQSRVRDQFFNREGDFIKSSANVYPNQSMEERLKERCGGDLTERQINAAAEFIKYCLRLNPRDRPTANKLSLHSWLELACMGCVDLESAPQY